MPRKLYPFLFAFLLVNFLLAQKISFTPEEQAFLDSNPTVVLGGDSSWEPMIIQNPDGVVTGFEREYLDELTQITGLKFELKAGVWKNIVKEAKSGIIDGLVYSSPEPQRLQYFDFSAPYNQFQVGFYSTVDHFSLSDTSELYGKVVGVQSSDQFMNNYLDAIPYIEKRNFDTRREMIEATLSGEIEFFFAALDINYYLWKNSIPGIKLVYLPDGPGFDVVFSIRHTDNPILSIINKGIASISPMKRVAMMNNWLRVDQDFEPTYSAEELEMLSSLQEISLVTTKEWVPIVTVDQGNLGGLVGDFISQMSDHIPISYQPVGTDDSLEIAELLQDDKAVFVYPDFDFKHPELNYTDVFLSIPYGLAMKRGSPFFSDIKSIGRIEVGVLEYNPHFEAIAKKYPNLILVPLLKTSNGLDRILSGEIDGYIGSISTLNYYIQTQGYSDVFIASLTDLKTDLRFSSSNLLLTSVFQKAMAKVPDAEKQSMIKKWYGSEIVETLDRKLAYQIAIISGVLLILLIGWIFSLRRVIRKRKVVQDLLQQNQANILALLENTDAMIYSLDIDLCLRAKNSAIEKFISNFTDQPVRLGAMWLDYFPDHMRERWLQRYLRALEGEKYSVQDSMKIDGEIKSYITSFNPIKVGGVVSGVSCVSEDVTELVQINQYMLSLMDTAYDHIFIKDLERRYVIASQSLADLNGFSSWKEMIGKREVEINEFNARQVADDELRVLEEGLHAINKEHQFMDKEGVVRWIQATTEPIYDVEGTIVGLSGVSRDITRRREAERQQKILISSIENSSDFISFLDEDFKFIYINRFGIERLGFEDYEGIHIQELLDDVTLKIVRNGMTRYALQGKIWEVEFDIHHWKTGEAIPMDHQIFPIYDDHEGFICYANVARDLTERNKLQAQVLQSKVNEQLMTATIKAEDKERYRIAHELHDGIQQKIATVNMYLQTLEENTDHNQEVLTNSIEKLNEAINEIRNMSHSLVPRALRNSGLAATLNDEVEQLNKNSTVNAAFHENIGTKRFHQDIELNLYRIFQEAMSNIFKHASANAIMVQLLESEERLSLMIEDDGHGFDAGDLEEAGFGLSSIKNRASGIGAHVEIDSVPNEGTSILVELEPDTYHGE